MKKYSIVVMYNQGETYRFSIRKSLVVAFFIFAIVAPIVAIYGIWTASSVSYENTLLQRQMQNLQARLNLLEAEQARLENYSAYMEQKSSHVFHNPMKDVINNVDTFNQLERQDAVPLFVKEAPVNNDPTNIDLVEAHMQKFTSLPFNLGMLTIDKIELKPHKDKNRYTISYDLYNSEKRGQISGKIVYSLLKKGNYDDEHALTPSRATEFSINNYKRTNALLTVANNSFEKDDVLKLTILTGDSIVYMQLIPLGE